MLVEVKRINKAEMTVVSSLDVAETFRREHKNVLRDIRELECSDEFRRLNFEQSEYMNEQNHKQPMFYMTRDGFTILVMGYTGEKAMRFKEAYIKQFNAMDQTLQGKRIEREKELQCASHLQKLYSSLQRMKECMAMLILPIPTAFIKYCLGKMQLSLERNEELNPIII